MTATPGDGATSPNSTRGSIPADTFSARLVLARHFAGRLSIEQAAKRCGLNAGNWGHWEDGRRPRDIIDVCQAISEALGISFDWLLLGGALTPSVRPHRMRKGPGEATVRYPQGPVRPTDNRPTGRALVGVGAGRDVGSHSGPPAGPGPRRPRRIK